MKDLKNKRLKSVNYRMGLWLLSLFIFVIGLEDDSNNSEKLTVYHKTYFYGDLLDIAYNVSDFTSCANLCETEGKCVSINYIDRNCELMNDTSDPDLNQDYFKTSDNATFATFRSIKGTNMTSRVKRQIVAGQCGRSSVVARKSVARIVGGYEAKPNSWPWTASLLMRNRHFCAASLISVGHKKQSDMLITAAHCVYGFVSWPRFLFLKFGCSDISKKACTTIVADKIDLHPKYDMLTGVNDIAVIKLKTPVTFNKATQPICLPSAGSNLTAPGMLSVAVGWGAISERGPGSNLMLQVDLPILQTKLCNSKDFYNGEVADEVMFCAGYAQGEKDSCQGDSGGPLMVKRNNSYYLAGIVSWGNGCARPNYPGVYTKVETFTSWIDETVKNNSKLLA